MLLFDFDNLTDEHKKRAVEEIIELINRHVSKQKQEENERTCEQEGHLFDEWNIRSWTTNEVVWDAGQRGYIEVEHYEWYRVCRRCKFKEKQDHEPEEEREKRIERETNNEIKSLEKRLEKLRKIQAQRKR